MTGRATTRRANHASYPLGPPKDNVQPLSRGARLLPRLAAGSGRAPALCNLLGLLGTALVGAGFVHLAAYHIPAGTPLDARWLAAALTLLARCPLRGPLGLIAVIAVLAPVLALRELGRLQRRDRALARLLIARRLTVPAGHDAVPRSPRRLILFIGALLGLQAVGLGLATVLCPIGTGMAMTGAPMAMPATSTLPLGPLHLLVATVLGLLLWRVEHRLTRLRVAVANRLRLLHTGGASTARPRIPYAARLPSPRQEHSLFARPPPAAYIAG